MDRSGKKIGKKGRNKCFTNNIQRGSAFIRIPGFYQQNKSALSAGLNCTTEQTAKPKESVKPATASVEPQVKPAKAPVKPKVQPAKAPVKSKVKPAKAPVKPKVQPAKAPVKPKVKPAKAPVKQQVEPSEVERKQPQPVNPWLKSPGTNLHEGNETVYCPDTDDYPLLRKERPKLNLERLVLRCPKEDAKVAENPQPDIAPEEPQPEATAKQPQVTVAHEEPKAAETAEELQVAPEVPQHAMASQNKDQTAKLKILLQRRPDTSPQQGPKAKVRDPAEAFFQQTGVKMVEVSELQFMEDRDENIRIKHEQMALLTEVEHLKEMLQSQASLYAETDMRYSIRIKTLQLAIVEKEHSAQEIIDDVKKMEEALVTTKHDQKKLELSLTAQREETSRLVAALAQAEEDLNKANLQWEKEKSRLLQCISIYCASAQQQALQQERIRDYLKDRIVDLEQKMSKVDKKPKKPSLWKRFRNLFKCTGRTSHPAQTSSNP